VDAAPRLGRLRGSRAARIGAAILVFWGLVALFAPLLAPWDPTTIDFASLGNRGFSAAHPLGTDATGRDLLSRLIWGARTTYVVVPLAGGSWRAGMAAGWMSRSAGWAMSCCRSRRWCSTSS
jgi:peptide/nickel transport system permease protein